MKSLVEIDSEGKLHLTDKEISHGYLSQYDILFAPYQDKVINIFEVGYWYGGSCELWKSYFLKAQIKAIDLVKPRIENRRGAKWVTRWIPPSGRVELELKDIKRMTLFDFVRFIPTIAIDDGSHELYDQLCFVTLLYPILRSNSLLIVEDIQNIDKDKQIFFDLGYPFEIYDNRSKTGNKDSVFLLFRK